MKTVTKAGRLSLVLTMGYANLLRMLLQLNQDVAGTNQIMLTIHGKHTGGPKKVASRYLMDQWNCEFCNVLLHSLTVSCRKSFHIFSA